LYIISSNIIEPFYMVQINVFQVKQEFKVLFRVLSNIFLEIYIIIEGTRESMIVHLTYIIF